jgi:hypothetical protein
VDLASPKGGKVELDALSDPRDLSGYSAHDLISMGFPHTPKLAVMFDAIRKVADCRAGDYNAIVVCGGQSPMSTFPTEGALHRLLGEFYAADKVTAALGPWARISSRPRPGENLPFGMAYWSPGSSSIPARLSRDWSSRRLVCEDVP